MILISEFKRRRQQLMRMIGKDAIAILRAAPERIRNNDAYYPYRQDSDFHYLTGFPEPDAVLVLVPGRKHAEVILFCRERHYERERWDGTRIGQDGAIENYACDDAFPISDIDDILPGLIEGRSKVHYHFGRDIEFDQKLMGWVNRVRADEKKGSTAPHEFIALSHLLHDMRLFKSKAELGLMQTASDIAANAHQRAMRICKPGMNEVQIEAELIHEFRSNHAFAAYEPIVGGGANACTLHYRNNNAALKDGDLLLIDAGAEFQSYASDITRTFPINGRFSKAQAALYEVVLAAQTAAIEQARKGRSWIAPHHAAVKVITQGLIDLKILKGSLHDNIAEEKYKPFYMHKTGHWIGLDVHDVGDYQIDGEYRVLEPGMVMTVEPGIYITNESGVAEKWHHIGIRIEDDVQVTKSTPLVLTANAPKEIADIEALMRC